MPTQAFFDQYPPFPADLPTLPIPRLSYGKLLSFDADESSALWKAATEHGFFLLDFRDTPDGVALLDDVVQTFAISKKFFEQSDEQKRAIPFGKGNVGYKPMGVLKDSDGNPDLTEMCNVTREDLVNATDAIPTAFQADQPLLATTVQSLHNATRTLLSHLAHHLSLPTQTLASPHDPSRPSVSVLRFLRYPPQPDPPTRRAPFLQGHTDNGTLTVLFTALGGLQVLPAGLSADGPANWAWVRPEPGCAVVNVGDALAQWTGGRLASGFHRVLRAPGAQARCHRYALGYFLKPAQDASMRRLRGGGVPALGSEEEVAADAQVGTYATFHRAKYEGTVRGENRAFGGDRGAVAAAATEVR